MGVVLYATIISSNVDGVMYIVGANEIDLSHVQVEIDNLKRADANIIGSVLNKYEANDSPYGYYKLLWVLLWTANQSRKNG